MCLKEVLINLQQFRTWKQDLGQVVFSRLLTLTEDCWMVLNLTDTSSIEEEELEALPMSSAEVTEVVSF